MKRLLSMLGLCLCFWVGSASAQTQQVSGTIKDTEGEVLVGVSVTIEGTFIGTTTDVEGNFSLSPDFSKGNTTLIFSYVGFKTQKLEVSPGQTGISIEMEESTMMADEVIVSASRVEERIMETPVTVESVGIKQLETQASSEIFSSLARFKGIDVNQSSLLISVVSTRGFNQAKSERLIQLVDYADYMSPSLSLYAGNIGGIPEIDIESVDIIYGANSALYGANAFNGVILTNSKDPFKYEGLSVSLRGGNRELIDGQLRVAVKLGNRLALKFTGSYFEADEFVGSNFAPRSQAVAPGNNPEGSPRNWDAIHRHGEIGLSGTFAGLAPLFDGLGIVAPPDLVYTPGFTEQGLVGDDYKARNWRINPSIHFLITDKIQASYSYRLGKGGGIYQSSNRYAWEELEFDFHKFEVKSDDWFVRVYRNSDAPGDTYDLSFTGTQMYVSAPYQASPAGSNPFADNALAALNGAGIAPNYLFTYATTYALAYNSALANGQTQEQAYAFAQEQADVTQPKPGEERFDEARSLALGITTPGITPRFQNNSFFWDFSGQYQLPIDFANVIVGASYRTFNLTSEGTLFSDGSNASPIGDEIRDEITNYEWGAYAQISKAFIEDRLKISVAGRLDNFKNFDSRFSPRISAVLTLGANRQHNFRANFAQAFRAPTQVDQYIYLDVGPILLLGNIGENERGGFEGISLGGDPIFVNPLDLERMNSWEIGYKGILFSGFYVDASYYRSNYEDFIGTQRFFGRESGTTPNPAEINNPTFADQRDRTRLLQAWLNADREVTTQGFQLGMEYFIAKPFNITANYTWAWIEELPDDFILGFNTPEHKFNIGVNGEPLKNFTYSANVRWQTEYEYFMPFDEGTIESFATVDAQVTYKVPSIYTTFKIGGTNLFDAEAIQVYGSAPIGRIVYAGATFDFNIFRK